MQAGGALQEELQELQDACRSMRRSNQVAVCFACRSHAFAKLHCSSLSAFLVCDDAAAQDLADRLAAAVGADRVGDAASAEGNAALRRALAELEAELAARTADGCALRLRIADLEAELAASSALTDRLRDENLELSSAVAAQSCDAARVQELSEALEVCPLCSQLCTTQHCHMCCAAVPPSHSAKSMCAT